MENGLVSLLGLILSCLNHKIYKTVILNKPIYINGIKPNNINVHWFAKGQPPSGWIMPEFPESCKLLLVEDDRLTRQVLSRFLKQFGHSVIECSNGSDGAKLAIAEDFDAIILDLMLPEVSGMEFITLLRKVKLTPVIMISSMTDVQFRLKALESGVDDFLVKPLNNEELLARIKAIRRRFSLESIKIVKIGAVTINMSRRLVEVNKTGVHLTNTEFVLLATLLEYRGRVLSRNFLQETVFGKGKMDYGNIVDQYVMRIRRKLGHEIITTKIGLGFIIDV